MAGKAYRTGSHTNAALVRRGGALVEWPLGWAAARMLDQQQHARLSGPDQPPNLAASGLGGVDAGGSMDDAATALNDGPSTDLASTHPAARSAALLATRLTLGQTTPDAQASHVLLRLRHLDSIHPAGRHASADLHKHRPPFRNEPDAGWLPTLSAAGLDKYSYTQ